MWQVVQASDVVIAMGCGDACPIFPRQARYRDRQLDAPAGRTADEIRPIRDGIDRRVREMLAEMTGAETIRIG